MPKFYFQRSKVVGEKAQMQHREKKMDHRPRYYFAEKSTHTKLTKSVCMALVLYTFVYVEDFFILLGNLENSERF